MRWSPLLLPVLIGTIVACSEPTPGPWRGVLQSPGGELPFGLTLEKTDAGWTGQIHNGEESIQIGEVRVDGKSVVLDFPHYDANVTATLESGARMTGRYWRQRGGETFAEMPFVAEAAQPWRFAPGVTEDASPYAGRWRVDFETEEDDAVAVFEVVEGEVRGTFLTSTGDYRFLAGEVVDGELRLSVFDGAHAFLFRASAQEDGSLIGDFWSSNYWHE
ncbi:MAG: hypothetical protein HKO53_15010, partial [Gemmatimonadetes bacterium]|nr:hypothetical protein [Gemmatimonadota bacterium]